MMRTLHRLFPNMYRPLPGDKLFYLKWLIFQSWKLDEYQAYKP